MTDRFESLRQQGISEELIGKVREYAEKFGVDEAALSRLPQPAIPYFGKEILEMAICALLEGENLLLAGGKATGKNVLAENLAYYFGRPVYNMSFHVNTDSSALIGTDTFRDNEVQLRKGPIALCAEHGGFGILDEINMAKNEAVAVLHATLDHRRLIDIPGYDRITLHPAARFIGTMNYGYAGTRDLNEALVSRFLVIDMPQPTAETVLHILDLSCPGMKAEAKEQLCGLFLDLEEKCRNGEVSSKPLDLRGLLAAIRTMRLGIMPAAALRMGVVNKSFDEFEKELVEDIIMTRIPTDWTSADVFEA